MNNLVKVGDPIYEPVSVTQLKVHCRISHNADDSYLDTLRTAARAQTELETNLVIAGQAYTWHTEAGFPSTLYLPVQPVSAFTSITYTDAAGESQTLDDSLYTFKSYTDQPSIEFTGTVPPGTDIVVNFIAGFPYEEPEEPEDEVTVHSVPSLLSHAVMFLAANWYENREPVVVGSISSALPLAYERIVQRLRVRRFR